MISQPLKNACLRMLEHRGYSLLENEEYPIEVSFYEYYTFKKNNQKCALFFINMVKFGNTIKPFNVDFIRDIITISKKYNHIIIIYQNNITASAKKIANSKKFDRRIELFNEKEITPFDKINHSLVPKHILVENPEPIIKKCGGDIHKFPKLLTTDPIAKYYGYKKNQLIKIIRRNGFVAYRVVC